MTKPVLLNKLERFFSQNLQFASPPPPPPTHTISLQLDTREYVFQNDIGFFISCYNISYSSLLFFLERGIDTFYQKRDFLCLKYEVRKTDKMKKNRRINSLSF